MGLYGHHKLAIFVTQGHFRCISVISVDKDFKFLHEATTSSPLTHNPLSPNSDENEISLYIIATCSNIQVMRIKVTITKDMMT